MDLKYRFRPTQPTVALYYGVLLGFYNLAEHLSEHPESVHSVYTSMVVSMRLPAVPRVSASAFQRHSDVFLLLIEHFPVRDGWDKTPLQATSYGGHPAIGKQLLDRGTDVGCPR